MREARCSRAADASLKDKDRLVAHIQEYLAKIGRLPEKMPASEPLQVPLNAPVPGAREPEGSCMPCLG